MLTFINSKLPDDWQISDKQYRIFQKCKSYEILNTDIYIGEDLEFIIHVSYCCIQFDHKIYIKCKKKPSNLTKVISSYNICSGIKSKKAKKPFVTQYKKLLIFFRNYSVPFHQVTFNHLVSCVLLIDKPNESFKNSKTFERNTLSTKKSF